jgi:hypothetical protein
MRAPLNKRSPREESKQQRVGMSFALAACNCRSENARISSAPNFPNLQAFNPQTGLQEPSVGEWNDDDFDVLEVPERLWRP